MKYVYVADIFHFFIIEIIMIITYRLTVKKEEEIGNRYGSISSPYVCVTANYLQCK